MKIGFIGLGIMGTPMAQHLLTAGHEMFVRTRSKVPEALHAAQVCASNADVARHADIIFLMLPDTPDVETVLFGKDGVAEGLSQGKIVVDMSSISPMDTKVFAQKINALEPDMVVITGDLFDGTDGSLDSFADSLNSINAPDGIYYVTGNHETYLGVEKVDACAHDKSRA